MCTGRLKIKHKKGRSRMTKHYSVPVEYGQRGNTKQPMILHELNNLKRNFESITKI